MLLSLPKRQDRRKTEPRHDKTNKMSVRPAKTRISLGIRPVWSEALLCTQWVVKDPSFLHADSEDSDQTGQMPRLIWVFAGHTVGFVMSLHNCVTLSWTWSSLLGRNTKLAPTFVCIWNFTLRKYMHVLCYEKKKILSHGLALCIMWMTESRSWDTYLAACYHTCIQRLTLFLQNDLNLD